MTALPGKKLFWQSDWVVAVLITFAIGWLHFYLLAHAGGFCGDEVNTINLARGHSLSFMARDSFPVLMPLLISGWTAMGLAGNDASLRLLGVLIGLGITGAMWLAVWTIRRAPPIFSLTLLGLNGTAVFWEVYLRAYGLGSMLIVLTMAAMGFLLTKPSWWRTGMLSVVAVMSVQALYQNAVFFAGIGMGGWAVCWLRKDKGTALKILAAGLVAIISLLPYGRSVSQWSQSAVPRPGFSIIAAADNFHTMTAFPLPQYAWAWKLLGLAVVGLGMVAFFRPSMRFIQSGDRLTSVELQVFAGTTLLASTLGYWVFLRFAGLITSPWYFLPLMAIGAVCFDFALPLTSFSRLFRPVFWGILIATVGIAIPFATRDLNCRYTNVDLVVTRLQKEISPQDYVVVTPWYLGISFNRYYKGPAVWDTLPPVADHSTYRFDMAATETENSQAYQPVLDRIAKTLRSGHRVWVVGEMRVPDPGRLAVTQTGRFIAEHSQSFETIDLKIKGSTSDYEDEALLMASGWRTNQP